MKLAKRKRDRLILLAILTVALSAGVWQLLIQSTTERLAKARELETAAAKKFEAAAAFLQGSSSLEDQAAGLSNQLAQIERTLANRADPFAWSYQLIMRATNQANARLELREVTRPQAPGPVGILPEFPYQAVSFELRGVAYWEELGRFLADFENRNPYFYTRNLQLGLAREADDSKTDSGAGERVERLTFKVDVVALVQPVS
jgi:hypothetical protein